jgi:aminoethylphosphonate catabolism LysR family transcriptional regulator
MNLTQLRAFHLVAQQRSFTRAANEAHVSQPTLSGQVKALEQTYRVRLFERRGRGVQLTGLGHDLFAITQRLFGLQSEAEALLAGTKALLRGHLRVAADSAFHAIPILSALKQRYGGLSFALAIGNSAAVLERLLEAEADVAVMAKLTSDPRLFSLPFRQDRLVLFVPRRHVWAARRQIRLVELAEQDLVLRERGSITREVIEERLAAAEVKPAALVEVQTREGVGEAVAAGLGIGVVFASEFGRDPRFRRVEIGDADVGVAEYVICLQERRRLALVRAFLEVAESLAARFRARDK